MSRGAKFVVAYATAVALALTYGFAFPGDGDGLSFIPLVSLALPWTLISALIAQAADNARVIGLIGITLGVCINAAVAYWLGARGRVSAQ